MFVKPRRWGWILPFQIVEGKNFPWHRIIPWNTNVGAHEQTFIRLCAHLTSVYLRQLPHKDSSDSNQSSAELSPHNLTFNRTPLSPSDHYPCYLINTLGHRCTTADANSMSVSKAAATHQGREWRSSNHLISKLLIGEANFEGKVLELSFSFEEFYLEASQRCPYTQSLEMFWPRIPFPVHGKNKIKNLEKKMYVKDRTQKFSIDEMNLGLKLKGRKYFYGLNELLPPRHKYDRT